MSESSNELLSIEDVAALTGHCKKTASRVMNETQRSFKIHGRKFILRDDLIAYLRAKADANGNT